MGHQSSAWTTPHEMFTTSWIHFASDLFVYRKQQKLVRLLMSAGQPIEIETKKKIQFWSAKAISEKEKSRWRCQKSVDEFSGKTKQWARPWIDLSADPLNIRSPTFRLKAPKGRSCQTFVYFLHAHATRGKYHRLLLALNRTLSIKEFRHRTSYDR